MVAQQFIEQDLPKQKILTWCWVARSSFYYQPTTGMRGRKPYALITNKTGQIMDNESIVRLVEQLFENPFVDYGYYKTYIHLNRKCNINISKHVAVDEKLQFTTKSVHQKLKENQTPLGQGLVTKC